jgi:hypothetical protein
MDGASSVLHAALHPLGDSLMAIDFPNAPTVGQVYDTGDRAWVWTGSRWDAFAAAGSGSSYTPSPTPPVGPNPGDLWFDTNTGRLYIWYDNTWVEVTGAPSLVDAGLLTGTTLAPNVVNYPSHTVLRNSGATEGGRIRLEGGTSHADPMYVDRFQDSFRAVVNGTPRLTVDAGAVALMSADIALVPTGRVRLGARNGYLPLAMPGALASGNYAVPSSAVDSDVPGMTIPITGAKAGDTLFIAAQLDIIVGGTIPSAEMRVGIAVNGSNLFYSFWNPKVAACRIALPIQSSYGVPSDGNYTVKLVIQSTAAGAGTYSVIHSYGSRMDIQHWGIR